MSVSETYQDIRRWYCGLQDMIEQDPAFQALRPFFTAGEEERSSAGNMYRLHQKAMMATYDSNPLVELIGQATDRFQQERLAVPSLETLYRSIPAEIHDLFWESGFFQLAPLEPSPLAAIKDFLTRMPVVHDRTQPLEQAIPVEELRRDHRIGSIPQRLLINCPGFWDLALDPVAVGLAGEMIGATPTIVDIDAWWSFADGVPAQDAQQFHLDMDAHRFCKLFLYLTDVEEDGGPHVFVEGTHDPDTINTLREKWPGDPAIFDQWFKGQLRKSDEEVQTYLGIEPTLLTGAAGTRVLVNTKGVHKGLKPMREDRLVIAIEYAAMPTLHLPIMPVRLGEQFTENIRPDSLKPPFDYIARLFLKP